MNVEFKTTARNVNNTVYFRLPKKYAVMFNITAGDKITFVLHKISKGKEYDEKKMYASD